MSQPSPGIDPLPQHQNTAPIPGELPPVEPPTAGFIVQLFVIPAVVVAVVVAVWLLFGKLAGGERDAMTYVETLKSDGANWRAAYELASLIQNDAKLAGDARLLGELTSLLDAELQTEANPKFDQYLALTLGGFRTLDAEPVGGRAVDPLATLASALNPKHATPVRLAAAGSLAKHAARLDETLDRPDVVAALARAGMADEVELRQIATYALGFFGGEAAPEALRSRLVDEDRFTRYNAAIALGRRGDPEALSVFREMLSTDDLVKVLRIESPTEKQSKIEAIQVAALQALRASATAGSPGLAGLLRGEVLGLRSSKLTNVRTRAAELAKSLPEAP